MTEERHPICPLWLITTESMTDDQADEYMEATGECPGWAMGVTHLVAFERQRTIVLLHRMGVKVLCLGYIPDGGSYYRTEPTKWRR